MRYVSNHRLDMTWTQKIYMLESIQIFWPVALQLHGSAEQGSL